MENEKICDQKPMKWHNFLVYFYFWAKALGHVAEAALMFSGAVYNLSGVGKAEMYSKFPGLKQADLYAGIIFLILAVVAISVRGKLKKRTKTAVGNFYAYIALSYVADVIYLILYNYMTGAKPPVVEVVGVLAVCAVYFGLNFWYYKKREHMFSE